MAIIDDPRPIILHDTRIILDMNAPALALFRCEKEAMIDRSLFDLLATDEFKALGRLRMDMLRKSGHIPPVTYPFLRCDGSVFWAKAETTDYSDKGDGVCQSILHFEADQDLLIK